MPFSDETMSVDDLPPMIGPWVKLDFGEKTPYTGYRENGEQAAHTSADNKALALSWSSDSYIRKVTKYVTKWNY